MINGIHHTAISTPDLERLKRFYCDVLGFQVARQFAWENDPRVDTVIGLKNSAAKMAKLRCGNAYIELFEYRSPTPKPADPNRPPSDHGFTHIALDVTDIDAEYARLKAAGMRFAAELPPFKPGQQSRALYGRDPDGNIIELLEILDPARGTMLSQAAIER